MSESKIFTNRSFITMKEQKAEKKLSEIYRKMLLLIT